jgi:16S rRNA (guanine527-N7)-methyltransferase
MNSPVNVTAIKEPADFATKHILDSIYFFMKTPTLNMKKIVDIGSGGGFPGLVLAIYYPDVELTLVDSVGKKCKFMEDCVIKLGLKNVKVINSRAEQLVGVKADLVTARGVGTVKEVLKFSENLVKPKGGWLMYKGEKLEAELAEAKHIIEERGLKSEIMRIEQPFTRSYLHLHR